MKLLSVAFVALSLVAGSAVAQEATPATDATAAVALPPGDATAGEAVFKKCAACHAVGEGAKHRLGPHLNDVYGRVAGTAEGYNYSAAMKERGAEGLVWTHETLAPFITDPKGYVPGTKMSFAGIKDPQDLANVLAYLQTFSPNYVPTAAPAGEAAPAQ